MFALDLATYRMEPLQSHGESPGWIFRHEAELTPDGIVIRGGDVWEEKDGEEGYGGISTISLITSKPGRGSGSRNGGGGQFSICNEERKTSHERRAFRGCVTPRAIPGKARIEISDLSDTFASSDRGPVPSAYRVRDLSF